MIDLDTLVARGAYSTVNAMLRDEVKQLKTLCDELANVPRVILRHMQPEGDALPTVPDSQIAIGRATIEEMELCAGTIAMLVKQKQDLRTAAWGGRK